MAKKLTSEKWQELYPYTKVIDPDGWDRKNFQYSWYEELIDIMEYNRRCMMSTIEWRKHDED